MGSNPAPVQLKHDCLVCLGCNRRAPLVNVGMKDDDYTDACKELEVWMLHREQCGEEFKHRRVVEELHRLSEEHPELFHRAVVANERIKACFERHRREEEEQARRLAEEEAKKRREEQEQEEAARLAAEGDKAENQI